MKIKKNEAGCTISSNGNELDIALNDGWYILRSGALIIERATSFKYALSLCMEIFEKLDSY